MEQYKNFDRVMETRDHLKNGTSLKSLISRGNSMLLLLLILCLGSCGQKAINIDMNGIDLEKTVANEIDSLLTSNSNIIVSYEQIPIQTSEQVFQNLTKDNVLSYVTLYPTLTYKLKCRSGWGWWHKEKPCEAMAYYEEKDGKLVGVGLIFSEKIKVHPTQSLLSIGYRVVSENSFLDFLLYAPLILLVLLIPFFIRLFGRMKQAQNRCLRCGYFCHPHKDRRVAENGRAFWHCPRCENLWDEI